MEIHLANVNPVQRTADANTVRRQSRPNDRRRFPHTLLPNDNSETEQPAEDGNSTEENDHYQRTNDGESAILSEVTAEELRCPAMAAARVLDWRGENDGYHR